MAGGGIRNDEGRGKFLTGELVEEDESKTKASDHIKALYEKKWVMD